MPAPGGFLQNHYRSQTKEEVLLLRWNIHVDIFLQNVIPMDAKNNSDLPSVKSFFLPVKNKPAILSPLNFKQVFFAKISLSFVIKLVLLLL